MPQAKSAIRRSLCEKSKNWSSNSNMLWRCSRSTPTYGRASEFSHSLEGFLHLLHFPMNHLMGSSSA